MTNTEQAQSVLASGRIVWTSGDLFQGQKKIDQQTKQVKRDQQGNEIQEYGFGLAVPKTDLADATKGAIWAAMHNQARLLYPSGQYPPGFAWKYKDGDSDVDQQGRPYSQREGYAGCLVFAMTTQQPIRFFKWENGNVQVSDGIKCGDYVEVQVSVKGHPAQGNWKPGLYLNPNAVRLVAPGKEIVNMPSADQVFGATAPAVPTGYVAPQPNPMPQTTMPTPGAPAPSAPQPYHGVLPPSHQPPQGGVAMAPPPVAAHSMPAPAQGGFPAPPR